MIYFDFASAPPQESSSEVSIEAPETPNVEERFDLLDEHQESDADLFGHFSQAEKDEDLYEKLEDMAHPQAKELRQQERLSLPMRRQKWQEKRDDRGGRNVGDTVWL